MYSVPETIETERLLLRRFKPPDLIPFIRFMTNKSATRFLAFPDETKTREGARQLFEDTVQSYDTEEPFFALAVEEKASQNFAGCCGVNPLEENTAEIFYAVIPERWGRGIATETAEELTRYLFEKTDTKTIKAFIVPGHEPSRRVAEKVGFQNTGLVENPNFQQKVHEYVLRQDFVN